MPGPRRIDGFGPLSPTVLAVPQGIYSHIRARRRRPRKGLSRPAASSAKEGPRLPLFYLDVETTGDDPQQDRIVSIQYQQLGDDLAPVGPFQIMAEWEWGEKQILYMILEKGVLEPTWDFVPVGNRVRFDLTFLIERATRWQLLAWDPARILYFWYTKPLLDLQPLLVLMNRGEFAGASLHAFSDKERGARVPAMYREGRYAEIIEYVTRERNAALEILHGARDVLVPLGDARRKA